MQFRTTRFEDFPHEVFSMRQTHLISAHDIENNEVPTKQARTYSKIVSL